MTDTMPTERDDDFVENGGPGAGLIGAFDAGRTPF